MKLTTKGRYAITAMIDIALEENRAPVPLRNISKRQNISLSYLEQLFSKLRTALLVKSVRGPGGGYILGKDSSDISLFEIITAVDENMDQTECSGAMNCKDDKPCLTHFIWTDLTERINQHMKNITLSDTLRDFKVKHILDKREQNYGNKPAE